MSSVLLSSASTTSSSGKRQYIPPVLSAFSDLTIASATSPRKLAVEVIKKEVRETVQPPASIKAEEGEIAFQQRTNEHHTYLTTGLATGGMIMSLLTMYFLPSALVIIFGVFPVCLSPYVVYQRHLLNKIPTMREQINLVRTEINLISVENDRLSHEVTRLDEQTERLNKTEQKLQEVVKCQSSGDVDHLRQLAHENHRICQKMKKIQDTIVLQRLIAACIRSDTNGDFLIDDQELNQWILRLKHLAGNDFDENHLRESFATCDRNSIGTLIGVTKKVLKKQEQQTNTILVSK